MTNLKQRIEKTKGTTVGAVSSALITIKMDFWQRIQEENSKAAEMTRGVNAVDTVPDNLSLTPRAQVLERERPNSHWAHAGTRRHTQAYAYNQFKKQS